MKNKTKKTVARIVYCTACTIVSLLLIIGTIALCVHAFNDLASVLSGMAPRDIAISVGGFAAILVVVLLIVAGVTILLTWASKNK